MDFDSSTELRVAAQQSCVVFDKKTGVFRKIVRDSPEELPLQPMSRGWFAILFASLPYRSHTSRPL
jgi:hypothetical protein